MPTSENIEGSLAAAIIAAGYEPRTVDEWIISALHYLHGEVTTPVGLPIWTRRAVANQDATVTNDDCIIAYTAITAPGHFVNFPQAPPTGKIYVVKDETQGLPGGGELVLQCVDPTVTIESAASYSLQLLSDGVIIYFNGTNYNIIGRWPVAP